MSKEKVKELIVCLVAIMFLAVAITSNVFASDDVGSLRNKSGEQENIADDDDYYGDDDEDEDEDDDDNVVNNTKVNNSVVNNSKANNSNKKASGMPDTGVDYSIVLIIAVCGISTVYAYKKIRDYNNM